MYMQINNVLPTWELALVLPKKVYGVSVLFDFISIACFLSCNCYIVDAIFLSNFIFCKLISHDRFYIDSAVSSICHYSNHS
jgi:hypothetical protein